jgi:hypothetical protein
LIDAVDYDERTFNSLNANLTMAISRQSAPAAFVETTKNVVSFSLESVIPYAEARLLDYDSSMGFHDWCVQHGRLSVI